MYLVDRSMAVIKPKQPLLDWLNSSDELEIPLTLDMLRTDCTTLLLPEIEEQEDAINWIDDHFERLFELELASWVEDQAKWPQQRSLKDFWLWFDVEVHSTVVDMVEEPLTNSPLGH